MPSTAHCVAGGDVNLGLNGSERQRRQTLCCRQPSRSPPVTNLRLRIRQGSAKKAHTLPPCSSATPRSRAVGADLSESPGPVIGPLWASLGRLAHATVAAGARPYGTGFSHR